MKWLTIAGILLYLTRHSDAGVTAQRIEREEETASDDTECLAGSEWESNCHKCRCSDSGVAECLKQDSCDDQVFGGEPIKCKPYTSFKRGCNTCTCVENGLGLCTVKDCAPVERKKRQIECKPGSTWQSTCNSCHCLANGLSSCTKRGCLSDSSAQKLCAPDTEWKNDCNACHCTSEGQPECTNLKCSSEKNLHLEKMDVLKTTSKAIQTHVRAKRGVCKPNEEFQVDCNPCKCGANGQSYTCSHNECLEEGNMNKEVEVFMESEGRDHVERHSVCKPRNTFNIGCNTCHCNPFGTDYSCTNKPCPLPQDVELFDELKETKPSSSKNTKVVCVANRMFIRDCNTCWCNEDGTSFFCTRRVCTPDTSEENITEDPEFEVKLRVVMQECRPNEVFEMDCNMCRCNADGKSFSCTRRACIEVDDKNSTVTRQTRAVQEPPKTCQPGQEFRMDCNKCLCNDEGQDFSCTRIDCAAANNNGAVAGTRRKRDVSKQVTTECVPSSVFDRDCNVCRCTEDGMHATCTIKRCKQETAEADTEPTPSFRCTPGDQFKRDCNDCTCSADGKNVFCTLRLCDQELADI